MTAIFDSCCVSKCEKYFERYFSCGVKLLFKVNGYNECSEIVEFLLRCAILDVRRLSKDTHVSIHISSIILFKAIIRYTYT